MKRRALKLLVFLLAGAIVNVAVAWGCAVAWPENWSLQFAGASDEEGANPIRNVERHPCWIVSIWRTPGSITFDSFAVESIIINRPDGPSWSVTATQPTSQDAANELSVLEAAYGWPLFSSFFRVSQRGDAKRSLEAGIALSGTSESKCHFHTLPLGPIWPGFAINTMFYAGLLWVVFFVPGRVRRTLRRRRGLCPACAYDLRGSTSPVCTECGKQVVTRALA